MRGLLIARVDVRARAVWAFGAGRDGLRDGGVEEEGKWEMMENVIHDWRSIEMWEG